MEAIETIDYKNFQINIYLDPDPIVPNEDMDESIFLVHYHRDCWIEDERCSQKALGYIYTGNENEYDKESADEVLQKFFVFPVSAYIHSGVVLSLNKDFGCDPGGWDTSHVGAICAKKGLFKDEKAAYEAAQVLLQRWNEYLMGDVYGYMIEPELRVSFGGSCWNFYGKEGRDTIIKEAKEEIDSYIAQRLQEHCARLKQQIKNRLPLIYRKPFEAYL